MKPLTPEMKDARLRAIMSARVNEIIAAHTPKGIPPCPNRPTYIIPEGMTGSVLKRIKGHSPLSYLFQAATY